MFATSLCQSAGRCPPPHGIWSVALVTPAPFDADQWSSPRRRASFAENCAGGTLWSCAHRQNGFSFFSDFSSFFQSAAILDCASVNLEGYVRSAAQCCGLRECGPHISRIERRRGSLSAMGKARDGGVWRRGRCRALHENRWREGAKRPSEIWLGSWTRRLCGGKARQGTRWRRRSAARELEGRRLQEERRG